MDPATTPGKADLADSAGLRQRYGLRSQLRRIALDWRLGACGTYVASPDGASVVATGRPGSWRAKYTGIATCGRIWTCPVCSAKLRAQRLARVVAAMSHSGGRWQMVTLTIRHEEGDSLARMMRGMMLALAKVRRVRAVRAIWERAITSSVRATEVTHGENGWHAHVHLLLRTLQWTRDERAAFRSAWQSAVERELGWRHRPDFARGVRFSRPCDVRRDDISRQAAYLAKMGCEIVGVGKESNDSRKGLSSWQVAACATARELDARRWAAWSEFQRSTRGRRMIELDDRAARWARQTPARDMAVAAAAFGEPLVADPTPQTSMRIEVPITSAQLRAIRRLEQVDPMALARPLTAARAADDADAAIRSCIEQLLERASMLVPPSSYVLPPN